MFFSTDISFDFLSLRISITVATLVDTGKLFFSALKNYFSSANGW